MVKIYRAKCVQQRGIIRTGSTVYCRYESTAHQTGWRIFRTWIGATNKHDMGAAWRDVPQFKEQYRIIGRANGLT